MATHMSIRLAWHSDGWNGHICKKPCENVYCVGQHSYPGELISEARDLEFEKAHAGESCALYPYRVACGLSANAFGKETLQVKVDPPSWWKEDDADSTILTLPPYTACTWCYEAMYKNDVFSTVKGKTYDYDKRLRNAEEYFAQFEEGKSLVFYYAGYSNPFSENEADTYVIVGVSRIKKIDDFHYYENTTEQIKTDYAGGVIWQKPITSNYPNEGLAIPYWKYVGNEEILDRIVIKPMHRSPFKYGSREVSNDDAIEIINQLLNSVDVLIEIGDDTENWQERKNWLNSVLNELWKARGPYPGFASAMINMGLGELVKYYVSVTNEQDMKSFRDEVCQFMDGKRDDVFGHVLCDIKKIRREYMLREDEEQQLLMDILPRFDISAEQMRYILSENREDVSIIASLAEIVEDPYIIFEQYIGMDSDDSIPLYKIDNGIISSPEYGIDNIFDVGATERLRAFCVDELNRIAAHSFGKAETILQSINHRLARMPEWKQYTFKLKNFKLDREIFDKALKLREDDAKNLFLYLKWVYEDERQVESVFTMLADRPDIALKMAITKEKFKQKLRNSESKLIVTAAEQYEDILDKQAEICMQIFSKPICVLSGAAGTGKTTVIRAIVENIERVHGQAAGFLLMAPTGKAAERIKTQTEKNSMTIHSFLASNGWLNKNFTLKRIGGGKGQDVNTIIIDECSMIDLNLFATLLRAINWNSVQRLILVGDPNQLPPIGRGKVFSDTIAWLNNEHPNNVGVLTENIRQLVNKVEGNGCGILDLAELFIQEKQSDMSDSVVTDELKCKKELLFTEVMENGNGDVDKDLAVYFWNGQEDLEKVLHDVLVHDMEGITGMTEYTGPDKLWQQAIRKEDGSSNPDSIQIISPYRGEFYGTSALNSLMQREFNPYWSHKYNLDGISYFDKVIQFRNRPKSDMAYAYNQETRTTERHEVFNGEIGLVLMHPFDSKNKRYNFMSTIERFQVAFSNKNRQKLRYNYGREYGRNEKGWNLPEQKVQDNLELAYAISVHKSQGSEFDYVYIVIPKRDSHLLSMELLYTAITRAQKKVTIFLEDDIRTLTSLGHIEKSAVRRINSSVFEFAPLPEEMLYIQNWYADEKKLSTLSEYFVRSKSEVIIANMLVSEEVPFIYEEPLYAPDGTMFLPDFTVKFRGETYYWEHVGRLDLPEYRAHWEIKEKWYNKHFPGKLLTTYEGKDLSIEAMDIIKGHK